MENISYVTNSALLRIPLALGSFYMAKTSSTPPRAPQTEERNKYQTKAGNEDKMSKILWWWLPLYWTIAFLVNAIEVYDILLTRIPALPLHPLYKFVSVPTTDSTIRLTPVAAIAFGILTSAYFFRKHAIQHMGRQFTFVLSLGKEHKLITDGPYSVVRHPGYLGAISLCLCSVVLSLSPGSAWIERGLWMNPFGGGLIALWVYLCISISMFMVGRTTDEDDALRKEFGEQWDVWAHKTRYKLIPLVF